MVETLPSKTPQRFAKTRLTEVEYQAFLGVLKGLGTTCSRMLRKMIRELIGEGPDLLLHELVPFREAVFQVGALGRNLNQLVKALHSGKPAGSQVYGALLLSIRDQVSRLEKELLAVVSRSRRRACPIGEGMNHVG